MHISITGYLSQGTCERSAKKNCECVIVDAPEEHIHHGVLSLAELAKMIRFRAKQDERTSNADHKPNTIDIQSNLG